jgi:hypothetical protein
VIVVLLAWGMVFLTNAQGGISSIGKKAGYLSFYLGWLQALPGYG